MIPKIIHYCWFGKKPLSSQAVYCIESWKKYCPDYEIKEWNETNFDINITTYSKEAASVMKWAFVSDVARFYVIYNYGGIYLDTDVEILKPLDPLRSYDLFIGFESLSKINTGQGFGAIKHFYLVKKMFDIYFYTPLFKKDDRDNESIIPSPEYTSKIMKDEGFKLNNTYQEKSNIGLFPTNYFCPKEWWSGKISITDDTY